MEHRVFKECSSLKTISVLGALKCLDSFVFQNCEALTTVTLGNGIKKVAQGMFGAFKCCPALKTINVPAKKGDYYKKRLPEELHGLIVEQ